MPVMRALAPDAVTSPKPKRPHPPGRWSRIAYTSNPATLSTIETIHNRNLGELMLFTATFAQMLDPETGIYLSNLPQGLTHLAVIQALTALADGRARSTVYDARGPAVCL